MPVLAAPAAPRARPRLWELDSVSLERLLLSLDDEEAHAILYAWDEWGRDEQIWRPGVEKYTLFTCGRFWGKTRTGAEAVRWVAEHPVEYFGTRDKSKWRIGLIGRTAADVRGTMLYGPSGLMTISDPLCRPVHNKSERTLTWPNGVVATTYSAEEPDQLRGPGFGFAWCDELAFWRLGADDSDDAWAQVTFAMREAKSVPGGARCVITTTPIPNRTMKTLIQRARAGDLAVRVVRGGSRDNAANIDVTTLAELEDKYKGTRLERQELHGDLLDDNPQALWHHDLFVRREIDYDLIQPGETAEEFVRRVLDITAIVVAIDPAVSSGPNACETGIVVAARGRRGRFYVLEDCSVTMAQIPAGALPERVWAQRAMEAAWRWHADWITAEVNNGGNLVAGALRSYMQACVPTRGAQPREVNYQAVHATKGKGLRGQPIALLYDQRRVEHVGDPRRYRLLEDQCCEFDPRKPPAEQDCDRMDALVWALTSLTEDAPSGEWSTLSDASDWDVDDFDFHAASALGPVMQRAAPAPAGSPQWSVHRRPGPSRAATSCPSAARGLTRRRAWRRSPTTAPMRSCSPCLTTPARSTRAAASASRRGSPTICTSSRGCLSSRTSSPTGAPARASS